MSPSFLVKSAMVLRDRQKTLLNDKSALWICICTHQFVAVCEISSVVGGRNTDR
jgi:hypothetical protein